eukprot:XP_001693224.1 predicted protein [Chlamydomonas reinhardtii]
MPTVLETRVHAKCLRSVDEVRNYFRAYRAQRRADAVHGRDNGRDCGDDGDPDVPAPRGGSRRPGPTSKNGTHKSGVNKLVASSGRSSRSLGGRAGSGQYGTEDYATGTDSTWQQQHSLDQTNMTHVTGSYEQQGGHLSLQHPPLLLPSQQHKGGVDGKEGRPDVQAGDMAYNTVEAPCSSVSTASLDDLLRLHDENDMALQDDAAYCAAMGLQHQQQRAGPQAHGGAANAIGSAANASGAPPAGSRGGSGGPEGINLKQIMQQRHAAPTLPGLTDNPPQPYAQNAGMMQHAGGMQGAQPGLPQKQMQQNAQQPPALPPFPSGWGLPPLEQQGRISLNGSAATPMDGVSCQQDAAGWTHDAAPPLPEGLLLGSAAGNFSNGLSALQLKPEPQEHSKQSNLGPVGRSGCSIVAGLSQQLPSQHHDAALQQRLQQLQSAGSSGSAAPSPVPTPTGPPSVSGPGAGQPAHSPSLPAAQQLQQPQHFPQPLPVPPSVPSSTALGPFNMGAARVNSWSGTQEASHGNGSGSLSRPFDIPGMSQQLQHPTALSQAQQQQQVQQQTFQSASGARPGCASTGFAQQNPAACMQQQAPAAPVTNSPARVRRHSQPGPDEHSRLAYLQMQRHSMQEMLEAQQQQSQQQLPQAPPTMLPPSNSLPCVLPDIRTSMADAKANSQAHGSCSSDGQTPAMGRHVVTTGNGMRPPLMRTLSAPPSETPGANAGTSGPFGDAAPAVQGQGGSGSGMALPGVTPRNQMLQAAGAGGGFGTPGLGITSPAGWGDSALAELEGDSAWLRNMLAPDSMAASLWG